MAIWAHGLDLTINSFDFGNIESRKKISLSLQSGFLTLIERERTVTRTTATAVKHIITVAILNGAMLSGIIKTVISDYFLYFLENSCKNFKANEKKENK